ncbi:helix-turn-helix domain-containing protein [Sporomusa ovata]
MRFLAHRTVPEFPFLCGFGNPSHFSTVFKRKVGVTPLECRKQL